MELRKPKPFDGQINISVTENYVKALMLEARMAKIKTRTAAMHTANQSRVFLAQSVAYGEAAFMECVNEIAEIEKELIEIADSIAEQLEKEAKAGEEDDHESDVPGCGDNGEGQQTS